MWGLPVRVVRDGGGSNGVPNPSHWYVLVERDFPWGSVAVYPAKHGGIAGTYHHQKHNGAGAAEIPWRDGDVCVKERGYTLGRAAPDPDPKGEMYRLWWYADRLFEWVERAATNALVRDGDAFELPHFRSRQPTVGFLEDLETFGAWARVGADCGVATLAKLGIDGPYAVRDFRLLDGAPVVRPRCGSLIDASAEPCVAAWIRVPRLPVVTPYAAALRWDELTKAVADQGVDLRSLLAQVLPPLRDQRLALVLVGFPIPETFGGTPCRMQWQPLQLDQLSRRFARGFRGIETALRKRDTLIQFAPSRHIMWIDGQNWSADTATARGILAAPLRSRRILIIGAGAIGSCLAELLARGGCYDLTVVDGELLEAGNLVRHTLTVTEVGLHKAAALAARLNATSPHAKATAVCHPYRPTSPAELASVDRCNFIFDCTGDDDVLASLARESFPPDQQYLSVSLGRAAARTYICTAIGSCFPLARFREEIKPYLERDRHEVPDDQAAGESAGCWHPLFRATVVDVWRAALSAVERAEDWCATSAVSFALHVLERGHSR